MRLALVPRPKVPPVEVQEVLRSFHEHQRLVRLVTRMTHEIERLHEDNLQLYAAIKIYREVARRRHSQGVGPSEVGESAGGYASGREFCEPRPTSRMVDRIPEENLPAAQS